MSTISNRGGVKDTARAGTALHETMHFTIRFGNYIGEVTNTEIMNLYKEVQEKYGHLDYGRDKIKDLELPPKDDPLFFYNRELIHKPGAISIEEATVELLTQTGTNLSLKGKIDDIRKNIEEGNNSFIAQIEERAKSIEILTKE